jgi:quercetin dioxygenase-like cupin family protein
MPVVKVGAAKTQQEGRRISININPTPYALGSEHGEMLWFFGMLVTMKATSEQTDGEFLLIE